MSIYDTEPRGIFTCRSCGECCGGNGGIVLRARDSERLAAFFGFTVSEFHAKFADRVRGKFQLTCKQDGACVFYSEGARCVVHPAKPDVCRTWPFFRGNLMDPVSLAMAGQGCSGIAEGVDFAAFSQAGARYLLDWGLFILPDETAYPLSMMHENELRQLAGANGAGQTNDGEVQ